MFCVWCPGNRSVPSSERCFPAICLSLNFNGPWHASLWANRRWGSSPAPANPTPTHTDGINGKGTDWLKRRMLCIQNWGHQKENQRQHYRNVFCVCQNSLVFGISLGPMLSWFHNVLRMGDGGSAISGAFLIKLWFSSVFECWWEQKYLYCI